VLSGHKSQSLDTSASGQGGHNQLVLDDSPGQARITLGSTSANTWLQLGHLVQQNDNQRLAKRGHGFDLGTQGHGAVRAAAGLQLSAQARSQGSSASAQPAEARAAISQLQQSSELSTALADTAQKHNAKLSAEPAPKDLPTAKAHSASIQSLSGTASQGGGDASSASSSADQGGESTEGGSDANIPAIQGGAGAVAAWQRPDILLSAPGGVAAATPAHSVMSAGATASLVAGLDINLQSQRHTALAVKAGLSLFTYGKAQNPQKPNAETGMQLHAASGSVSVQAQASTVSLAAQQNIQLASTTNAITAGAPQHILLVGGGSGLKITSGNITLTTSGPANFGAGMKVLTGGSSASSSLSLKKPANMPTKPMPVNFKLLDAEGLGPAADSLELKIADAAQNLGLSAGSGMMPNLKPGLVRGKQPSRRG
jgi:type VI secretion system secreted protein VgrG